MRMNLKVWMMVKIIPAIVLVAYYHLMVSGYALAPTIVTTIALLLLAVMKFIKRRCVEPSDELAIEIKRRVDALCYKLSVVAMGILVLPFVFLNPVQTELIGYLIVGCIAILTIFQAVAFFVMDKKGI